MRIGCCLIGSPFKLTNGRTTSESNLDILVSGYHTLMEAGFDYAECAVGQLLQLTEEELAEIAQLHEIGMFTVESCNCFIPGSIPLTGENTGDYVPHIREVYRRMQLVGADTVVFGSGGARRIPEGFDRERASAQLDDFMRSAAEIAKEYGITIVIEPLNSGECNVILSTTEGADYARRVDHPNLKLLADIYHMSKENEPYEVLLKNADILRHVHVSEYPSHYYPGRDGGECVRQFADVLRRCGYEGRVTIECYWNDYAEEVNATAPFMKEVFK